MNSVVSPDRVDAVRAFNRFYTSVIGVLNEGLLQTSYSLTEARVIFELARRDACEVADLRRSLGLDAGYLSRMLTRFEGDGLIVRGRAEDDARRQSARLTDRGREVFQDLDCRSAAQIEQILAGLPEDEQRRLLGAMAAIEEILGERPRSASYLLRPLGPGDLGWVVQRHGALYAAEYGYNTTFETLVARVVAEYAESHGPGENAWIAEIDGRPAGTIFCVRESERVARLRLLLVEPFARGRGVGGRLVEECVRFARRSGYEELVLWTHDNLGDARRLYERAGFELGEEEPSEEYGPRLTEQTWRLKL
ncbi:bifunctional helix-turn-helix transcriptional regulator/GNAT family N-acetyltransferase [Actinoallomurus rhizosphaericola]|uniref:bifunctional helix-turn-helix transcriptional regulator/GNAT family N-acetyltransferase n=1 Tax=Actinoallomurus rhizosphaericola TaxID=2952536 RepID=UPI00209056B7|nr:helix-turn-helix domain-containing GNAT family N-acetyltransferase [Actinoallomurus rhizosphaericola]MCO5993373.1 helix-turn-helix domain-containing GNAT family N-acetyltransferase [Actinoallomurus rhizosphaericola]